MIKCFSDLLGQILNVYMCSQLISKYNVTPEYNFKSLARVKKYDMNTLRIWFCFVYYNFNGKVKEKNSQENVNESRRETLLFSVTFIL